MKVCFVGVGSIGKRHIKNLVEICKNENEILEIHLLRSSDRELEEEIICHVKKTVLDIEQLDEKYDAVFVTNPTFKHYDTIKMFIEKTDIFFIEKPVFDRVDRDISCLLMKNKKYYVACPLRYTRVLLEAEKIIKQEQVFSARAISSSYLPNWREGVDYRTTYSAHKEQGGGVKIDLIHEWDYLRALFGEPEKIYSLSGKYSNLEIDSEDLAVYIAKYPDKIIELHLDYFGKITRRNLEVRTSENEYIFDIAGGNILKNGKIFKKFEEKTNDKYKREMQFFYGIFKGTSETTNDLLHAVETIMIAEGVKKVE